MFRVPPIYAQCKWIGLLYGAMCAAGTASAQVSVKAPSNGNVINSTPYLQAASTSCNSQATVSMGYSFDTSQTTYTFNGAQNLQVQVPSSQALSTGAHTIHLKAWNGSGFGCDTPVSVTVTDSSDSVKVTSPTDGNTLYSPFTLTAAAPKCNGQTTGAMKYATDSNADSATFNGGSMNTSVSTSGLATGWHILRAKAWGSGGSYCETDLQFNVPPLSGIIPATTASQFGQIEINPNYTGTYNACPNDGATNPIPFEWQTQPDCNTNGGASNHGATIIGYGPAFSTYTGNASPAEMGSREFVLTPAASGGGVRWFDPLGSDDSATHFIYDLWIYFPSTTDLSNLQELELDVNHSITSPTKLLYVLAVQCSFGNKWQISPNGSNWQSTDQNCNSFTAGAWHHVQIESQHGSGGNTSIQYDSIAIDGTVTPLTCSHTTCTGTAQTSTWSSVIGPNFQMDGTTTGGVVHAYVDAFNIFYWP